MAEDKRSTPGEAARRRRPPPTIDLTAAEVKSTETAAPGPADAGAAPAAEAIATPETARWSPPKYIAFGATFGVGVAATLAALWYAGVIPPRSADNVSPRLAALEAQLRELSARPAPALESKSIDELTQRLGKVEQAANRPAAPAQSDAALNERIAAIESGVAALGRRVDQSATALARDIGSLQEAMRQANPAPTADIDALRKRLAAIEQAATATQDQVAQNSSADLAARRALAAFALRDAVGRGASFSAELAAMKNLDAAATALAPLEPFAARGLPTDAELVRELSELLPALIDAAGADPARAGGFFERLEANAGRLVRIRPAGAPGGDDPAAVLARIEVKLAHSDIAGTETELAKLPAKARALAEPWSKKAAARSAALAASRKLVAESAAALGAR